MLSPSPPLCEMIDAGTVRLHCPAKVNLALSVGAPRSDGLHPIASWMVPITWGDTLELRRAATPGVFDVCYADDAPRKRSIDWPIENDLAYRALRAVESYVGRALPVEVTLRKRIPTGAGLGGGSADAAAMIDGIDRLFGLQLDDPTCRLIARSLGSDVVFQFAARRQPTGALVTGTGAIIEPLPKVKSVALLLLLPDAQCPTSAVYGAFDDAFRAGDARGVNELGVARLAGLPLRSDSLLFNDLAKPACAIEPAVQHAVDALAAMEFSPHVTGSGSTVFIVLDALPNAENAKQIIERVEHATRCAAVLTQTVG